MALIMVFVLGVANFAMHKAVLESGHPMLAQMPAILRNPRRPLSLGLEFAALLGTMLLVYSGSAGWAIGYAIYSGLNALSAWAILNRRI